MRTTLLLLSAVTLTLVAGCHDSDDDDGPSTPSGNALVTSLIRDNTTDSAEPVELNDLDLDFSEDEGAFSDLLDG